jgi:peptidoglycan-associated lipoprotein
MAALRDCQGGKIVKKDACANGACDKKTETVVAAVEQSQTYYPDTRQMMIARGDAREGVIIVNNVNVPEHLINPVPVQPLVFNQNIYGGDKTVNKTQGTKPDAVVVVAETGTECDACQECPTCPECNSCANQTSAVEIPQIGDELVTSEEFVNMMMAMRSELAAINARLDELQAASGEKTMIKVQQIPLEPKQHVMEEVFEVRFDFNKSIIKPEYQELIKKLATATQENKNIKVSVVGHTDTAGSSNYNYALGGRRAEAVQKMLIQYGIPSSQIVAVSAGEEDLAVPTPDNTPNAANRRVRVVKEVHYTEQPKPVPMEISVEEVSAADCGEYGCEQ